MQSLVFLEPSTERSRELVTARTVRIRGDFEIPVELSARGTNLPNANCAVAVTFSESTAINATVVSR